MTTNISIIGSGLMGAGIGLVSAIHGYNITFYDIEQKFIDGGLARNKKYLDRQVSKGKMTNEQMNEIFDRMKGTLDLKACVSQADLVIEAIVENMAIKKKVWAEIGEYAPDDAVFGSNTSSLSITELAKASGRPKKFLGTHFFNPPVVLRLLEIIKGYETDDATLNTVMEFGKSLEMKTVFSKDVPGFIVNRLLMPQLNEAFYAVMEGVATIEDIDTAVKTGLNHPMGPLTLADFVGLDTCLYVSEYLHRELGEKYRPCPLLKQMVLAGKLGRKSGEGFYKYD